MHVANSRVGTIRCAMVCSVFFVFLGFYNFITGIVLYLTYELVQILITFNRTDLSLFKQVN